MKPHILFLALVAVLAVASAAFAKGGPKPAPPGKATPSACRGRVALIVRGTFLSAATSSFQMLIRRANHHARALRGPRELSIDAKTRFRRNGKPSLLAAMQPNDRLLVYARGCKRTQAARLELLAKNVFAHGARLETPR
jgi:hypothetical protein